MPPRNRTARQTSTPAETSSQPAGSANETVGHRLRNYRIERGISLTALAQAAGLSKGYLSSLESDEHQRRPSAEVLYALAQQLGVTMSDLMGRKLLSAASPEVPDSLARFAAEAHLNEADIAMLASIRFRGEQPRSPERWRYIYDSIRNSAQMDKG
jgi:transcriptional regulator with XRE-family HTH domain